MKYHQKITITKTEMSIKLKCYQNGNVTKNEMLPKTEMSHKAEMSPKLKCCQNKNVTKTKKSPKLKCTQKKS